MSNNETERLIQYLSEFVSENKQRKIRDILKHRTRHVTLVLEDIFQSHNATATLRTAECLGVQDIYIVENRNEYRLSPEAAQGAGKWVSLHRFREDVEREASHHDPKNFPTHNTEKCLNDLKSKGYQIIATTPDKESIGIDEIDITQPVAFLFGSEGEGLTQYAIDHSDATLRLPMVGVTKSYNISVSVAMTLSQIMKRIWESKVNWHLTKNEEKLLTLNWYKKCIKNSDLVLKRAEQN